MTTFSCTHCGKGLRVAEEWVGQKVRCPHCQQVVSVPAAAPSLAVGSAASGTQRPQEAPSLRDPATTLTSETPPPPSQESDPACSRTQAEQPRQGRDELTSFLTPPRAAGELGWLGVYRVLRVLGQGGMGAVFLAEDTTLGRQVALKVMLPELAASGSARERFQREARLTAAVENDHVIPIYFVGEERGVPYLVMPVLRGETLDQRLRRDGRLPLPEILRIGRETAEGLAAAHAQGLIHRDIKPSNIWLESRGQGDTPPGDQAPSSPPRVKILDFGLARPTRADVDLTQQGALVGTPAYMAPEQVAGKAIDHHCDLFSLGCVLYRMATGETAFKGQDTISVLMAVATGQPRPPHEIDPALPRALSALILSLLAKEPERRPASARSVCEALAALDADRTASLPALPPPASPSTLLSRRRRALMLGGTLVALLLAALVAAMILRGQMRKGAPEIVSDDPSRPLPPDDVKEERPIEKGGPRTPAVPADALRRQDIPAFLLAAAGEGDARNAPAELVAILGDSRLMHWGPVRDVAFSPDGKLVASAGWDWTARLWDPATGRERAVLVGARGAVNAVAFRHDGRLLATAGGDGRIRLWAPDGQRLPSFAAHEDTILALAFAPKDSRLASAGKDGHVKVWDSARKLVHDLTAAGPAQCLAWAPDGLLLASGDATGVIQLWDVQSGKEVRRLATAHGQVQGLAFRGDGRLLASVGADGALRLWDPDKDKPLYSQVLSTRPARAVAFQPDGKLLAVNAPEKGVLLWDSEAHKVLAGIPATAGTVSLAFRPDGKAIVLGGSRGLVDLYSVPEGKPLVEKLGVRGTLASVSFSSDGKVLASGGSQPRITLWDVQTGKPLPVHLSVGAVQALAIAPHSMLLASAAYGSGLHLWDGVSGKLLHSPEVPAKTTVGAIAFHPEGDLIAAACSDHNVRTWATASGKLSRTWPVQRDMTALAFRGDGARVAVGTRAGVILLYDLQGNPMGQLRGLKKPVTGLTFAATSALLVSSTGAEIQVWDTQGNKELRTLTGHGALVTALALRGDGRRLASFGVGGLLRIWDMSTGETERIIRICPPGGRVAHLEYSPDGRYLATANGNGTAYLLRLDEPSSSARADKRAAPGPP